jgi:hypothetical protein
VPRCWRHGGKDVGKGIEKDVPCELRGERQIEETSEQLQGEFPGGCDTAVLHSAGTEINSQSAPRSKHTVSVIKTSQLMLCWEIFAVCSQIHTKHINTLCGQNVELLNGKLAVHIVTTGL